MHKRINLILTFLIASAGFAYADLSGIVGPNTNLDVNKPFGPVGPGNFTPPPFGDFNINQGINSNVILITPTGNVHAKNSITDINSIYTSTYDIKNPKNVDFAPEKRLKNYDKANLDGKEIAGSGKKYKESLKNNTMISEDGINFTTDSKTTESKINQKEDN